jgi:Zn-dependent peptidase ImmA (M78 family)/transcriptional regulator with XRE-family HTH domain
MHTLSPDRIAAIGQRLKLARTQAGFSLRGLATALGGIVSHEQLRLYEAGKHLPEGDRLVALAHALKVRLDFLLAASRPALEHPKFRKLSRLKAVEKSALEAQVQVELERYLDLEEIMAVQTPFENPIQSQRVRTGRDVEVVADEFRAGWKLGVEAIHGLAGVCEDHGIRIIEVSAPGAFVGLSGWAGEIPFVILNRSLNADLCRKRFTLLHELAHLLLDFDGKPSKEEENLCHAFAGAVLVRADTLRREFFAASGKRVRSLTLRELVDFKEAHGISIAALVKRAEAVDLVTPQTSKAFWIAYNRAGYRTKGEPGHYAGVERPTRFQHLLLRAVADEIISLSKAAVLGNTTVEAIRGDFTLSAGVA